jgi:hypothetical protein
MPGYSRKSHSNIPMDKNTFIQMMKPSPWIWTYQYTLELERLTQKKTRIDSRKKDDALIATSRDIWHASALIRSTNLISHSLSQSLIRHLNQKGSLPHSQSKAKALRSIINLSHISKAISHRSEVPRSKRSKKKIMRMKILTI